MGTLGHAAKGPVAFGAPVRPYEAAKPKSADRPSRVSVCEPNLRGRERRARRTPDIAAKPFVASV